jgi:hypothetical protein
MFLLTQNFEDIQKKINQLNKNFILGYKEASMVCPLKYKIKSIKLYENQLENEENEMNISFDVNQEFEGIKIEKEKYEKYFKNKEINVNDVDVYFLEIEPDLNIESYDDIRMSKEHIEKYLKFCKNVNLFFENVYYQLFKLKFDEEYYYLLVFIIHKSDLAKFKDFEEYRSKYIFSAESHIIDDDFETLIKNYIKQLKHKINEEIPIFGFEIKKLKRQYEELMEIFEYYYPELFI